MSRYCLLLIFVGLVHSQLVRPVSPVADTAEWESHIMSRIRNRRENTFEPESNEATTVEGEGEELKTKLLVVIALAATVIGVEAMICIFLCFCWSPRGSGQYPGGIANIESATQIAETETTKQTATIESSYVAKSVAVDETDMAALKRKLELVAKEQAQKLRLPSTDVSRTQVSGLEKEEPEPRLDQKAIEDKLEANLLQPELPLEIATEPADVQKIKLEKPEAPEIKTESAEEIDLEKPEETEPPKPSEAEPIPEAKPEALEKEAMPESIPDEGKEPLQEPKSPGERAEPEPEKVEEEVDSEASSNYPMENEPRAQTDHTPWQYGKIAEHWRKLSVDAVPILPTGSSRSIFDRQFTYERPSEPEPQTGEETPAEDQDEKVEPDEQKKEGDEDDD